MQTQEDLPHYDVAWGVGNELIHQVEKYWFKMNQTHRDLDRTIENSYNHYASDLRIKELKAQKLRIKDEIERCRSDLENLVNRISKS